MDTLLANLPSLLIFPGSCIAVLALLGGPTIWRMSRPTPPDDLVAISRFAANRDQHVVEVKKLWLAPWRMQGRSPQEAGRPYRLCAEGVDGSRYIHTVTADQCDAFGNVELKQRLGRVWIPVLQ